MLKEESLRAIWADIEQNQLFKPCNFLRDFWLSLNYDLRLLDPAKLRLAVDNYPEPQCRSCAKNCCQGTGSIIVLTLPDIARLLDAGLEEYIDTGDKKSVAEVLVKERPHLKGAMRSPTWRKFPLLKRVNGVCPHLQANSCAIYAHRPLSCRHYPYTLSYDLKSIHFSRTCKHTKEASGVTPYIKEMTDSVVELYNQKIKDLIILSYAPKELKELGLDRFICS